MGFFNKRSYKLTPEQLKASGLEVIQNQTLKTHKLKTHKLKTHKLKSDKLESREITREELIDAILESNPWTDAGMKEFKGVPVAPKPTGVKARIKTEINKLGRKAVKRYLKK